MVGYSDEEMKDNQIEHLDLKMVRNDHHISQKYRIHSETNTWINLETILTVNMLESAL